MAKGDVIVIEPGSGGSANKYIVRNLRTGFQKSVSKHALDANEQVSALIAKMEADG